MCYKEDPSTAHAAPESPSKPADPERVRRAVLSRSLGSTTFRTLYPDALTKTSISQLDPMEMVRLAECLKTPPGACCYTESELHKRTELVIASLPKYLRNPLGKSNQNHMTRFFQRIGASTDTLPAASLLCMNHQALSGQLTASACNLFEYCAEDILYDVSEKIGRAVLLDASPETSAFLQAVENVMAGSLSPEEFEQIYKRQLPDNQRTSSKSACDACILRSIISSPDTLCGLRGLALYAVRNNMSVDDYGHERGHSCKVFVEACIATYDRTDALLMVQLSDHMTDELERFPSTEAKQSSPVYEEEADQIYHDSFSKQRDMSEADDRAPDFNVDVIDADLISTIQLSHKSGYRGQQHTVGPHPEWTSDPVTGNINPNLIPAPLSSAKHRRAWLLTRDDLDGIISDDCPEQCREASGVNDSKINRHPAKLVDPRLQAVDEADAVVEHTHLEPKHPMQLERPGQTQGMKNDKNSKGLQLPTKTDMRLKKAVIMSCSLQRLTPGCSNEEQQYEHRWLRPNTFPSAGGCTPIAEATKSLKSPWQAAFDKGLLAWPQPAVEPMQQ